MEPPRWLTAPEARAWRGYRRMRALLDLRITRDFAEDGLSDADYDVLSNLGETPGNRLRTREMAARMLWSTSRLSHHVSRMEKRGLVRRLEAEEDARGSEIALTDHGREVLEAAAPAHVASVREHFIDLLTEEELRVLGDIAEKVVERLARDTPTRSPERRVRGRG
ncbi:hypothetical protein SUDANB121_01285 [Nocardiopsis dassonvillei]|uniref:MarR family winged helix-turn-helix transcriptional regulator n=1 Tax=Nocardiopsis dassonvillei TaxID=2014 RepID=UPI003F57A3DF